MSAENDRILRLSKDGMSKVKVVDGRKNRNIMYQTGWVNETHLADERT